LHRSPLTAAAAEKRVFDQASYIERIDLFCSRAREVRRLR
jgi:hypothetical protein